MAGITQQIKWLYAQVKCLNEILKNDDFYTLSEINPLTNVFYLVREGTINVSPVDLTAYLQTKTSDLVNDGANGVDPYITTQDVVPTVSEQIDVSAQWIGGLEFNIIANRFPVNNLWYSATEDQETLDPADVTFDRIDLLIANTNGTVGFITGVASANPGEPNYDFATQYPIKFVLVKASSSTPDGYEDVSIFDEDLGEPLEWIFNPVTDVVASTNDFYSGTLSIEGTNTMYNTVEFKSTVSVDRTTINTFSFWLKLKEDVSSSITGFIYLFFYNSFSSGNADTVIVNDGQYGFDAANLGWQKITIDLALAGVTTPLLDTIRILPYRATGMLGWFIDKAQVQIQTVVVVPPSPHPTNTSSFINDGENGNSRYIEEIELDNIAKVIYVNEANLSPGATLEDRIAAYVNTLGYDKLRTDAEIWIEYSDEVVTLTSFLASSTTGDACTAPDLSPYNVVLYHNGTGAYPANGDIVTLDDSGTLPIEFSTEIQMANLEYLKTNASGVRLQIICP